MRTLKSVSAKKAEKCRNIYNKKIIMLYTQGSLLHSAYATLMVCLDWGGGRMSRVRIVE